MDLSIVIPQSASDFFTNISTCLTPYSPLNSPLKYNKKKFPSAPKKEIKKIFNWGEYDIQEYENSFYKPSFNHNTYSN